MSQYHFTRILPFLHNFPIKFFCSNFLLAAASFQYILFQVMAHTPLVIFTAYYTVLSIRHHFTIPVNFLTFHSVHDAEWRHVYQLFSTGRNCSSHLGSCSNQQMHTCKDVKLYIFWSLHWHVSVTVVTTFRVSYIKNTKKKKTHTSDYIKMRKKSPRFLCSWISLQFLSFYKNINLPSFTVWNTKLFKSHKPFAHFHLKKTRQHFVCISEVTLPFRVGSVVTLCSKNTTLVFLRSKKFRFKTFSVFAQETILKLFHTWLF